MQKINAVYLARLFLGADLANIGIDDGKVRANANTGNDAGDDESGVVTNEGVKQRT